ncbi:MAG: DUF6101 family protein [Pseudolabrys sp.]
MRMDGCPAGSGRAMRLDPFALPVRFSASDAKTDGYLREVELHRSCVVVRRSLAGMRMAVSLPVAAFAGVGLRYAADAAGLIAVVLAHRDPGLTLPLFVSCDADEAVAEWRAWGVSLRLQLLIDDGEGWHAPFTQLGEVRTGEVRPRRRRRSALKRRRPSILLRRPRGELTDATPVHRGEREIVARN